MSIPFPDLFPPPLSWLENWAVLILVPVLIFYLRLSRGMAFKIFLFAGLCVALNYQMAAVAPLWAVSLLIFALAWLGQFYGHKLEGKKPSFLKDLQFLLIGPAWVIDNILK